MATTASPEPIDSHPPSNTLDDSSAPFPDAPTSPGLPHTAFPYDDAASAISTPVEHLDYRDSPDPASTIWSEYNGKSEQSPYDDTPLRGEGKEEDGIMIVKEKAKHHATVVFPTTSARRWWLRITWGLTWWVPSFCLTRVGKMKRADVRMAWREKLAIVMMIAMLCLTVLFYIIFFGRLLCPKGDKAWNTSELAEHAGDSDYYAAIAGKVYDVSCVWLWFCFCPIQQLTCSQFSKFYKGQHSDIPAYPTTSVVMLQFAGQDLTDYFPPPMIVACPGLVTNNQLSLQRANFTVIEAYAVHTSGALQTINGTALDNANWYESTLLPDLVQYYKGSFVYDTKEVQGQADVDTR